jgi:hypothetical protein
MTSGARAGLARHAGAITLPTGKLLHRVPVEVEEDEADPEPPP